MRYISCQLSYQIASYALLVACIIAEIVPYVCALRVSTLVLLISIIFPQVRFLLIRLELIE